MLKFNAALQTILDSTGKLEAERVALKEALGRVLAEDIYASSDIPGFDNSAMDGFAVLSSDTIGASGSKMKILEVIGDLKAGEVAGKKIKYGQAMRIMTGAMIPKGADSVVMVEWTKIISKGPKELIGVYKETGAGENIRRRAEDIKRGELIIPKATQLTSAHVGILASLGRPSVKVSRRPKIAILATGDELVDVDRKAGPGKLRSSNTYILYSQIIKNGCIPKDLGISRDSHRLLEKKIARGLDCDIILTSGGVSVGKYDFVKDVLDRMGTIKFWQVAIRPGKPMVFGKIKRTLVFGLPGNPVSGIIGFEMFVRPSIEKMQGRKNDGRKEVEAIAEDAIDKKKGFRYFLRARTRWEKGAYHTGISGPQGSAMLKSMSLANSLIILEEDKTCIEKGAKVMVRFL